MKLFGYKLRPEIGKLMYWVHVIIIAVIVLAIVKYFFKHDMLTFDWIWKFSIAIAGADIIAHTLLGFD